MTKIDKYIVFSIFNAVLVFTIVFNTVINFYWFIIIITILVIISNILINKNIIKLGSLGKNYFFSVTFPMIINAFFLINYLTGTNPTQERYCYKNMVAEVGGRGSHEKGKTTYIYLSGDAYKYSYMTRSFFIDYKRMLFKNQITYTFERGIFGMKIRKDYKFILNDNCSDY